jgi:hypothetical protein
LISVEADVRLVLGRNVRFGVDRFHRAFGHTSGAINAFLGMNDQLILQLVKTGHWANFDAVGESASLTFTGNNMGHSDR